MSQNHWKKGGAFKPLREKIEKIQNLYEKAVALKSEELEKQVKNIKSVEERRVAAKDLKPADFQGRIVSDVVEETS